MGAPEATATMRHDHVEIAGLAEELDAIAPELEGPSLPLEVEHALRRILYGLYVLIKVHFVEEEEIYLPLLEDRLDEAEAREMIGRWRRPPPERRLVRSEIALRGGAARASAMTSSASGRSLKPSTPPCDPRSL